MTPGPPRQATAPPGAPSWMAPVTPVVPDHELVRRIGGGSYGDVWLARTTVGAWRAIKVVFRDRFLDARPYEREFNGIRKFEPLSRSNEAFIDILQIGRNEAHGYFYYVMELADDAGEGAPSDCSPDRYVPRTLAKVLLRRGRLPIGECLDLGLTLNLGLARLHQAGLIHRDIKPSNIIFVGGVPKLADIGLVIETSEARSFVGTEGYIPPEGPTSPQSDLFSLGKVLYEAGMGKDRKDFPEPMTGLADLPEAARVLEFNAILLKACAASATERYRSAEEMNADLALLQSGGSVRRQRKLAGQLRFVQRVGVLVTALAGVIALGWWWQARQTQLVRTLAEETERARRDAQENLYLADIQLAYHDWESGQIARTIELLRRHIPRTGEPDLRHWEWYYLLSLCHREVSAVRAAPRGLRSLHGHPASGRLAVACEDGKVRVLALPSGRLLGELDAHTNAALAVAWHPDGSRLASGGGDGRLIVWETATRRPLWVLDGEKSVQSLTWSPDGTRVAAGGIGRLDRDRDGLVTVWDAGSGRRLHRLVGEVGEIRAVAWRPDGTALAAGENYFGRIQIWDPVTGALQRTIPAHGHFISALAWSADGRQLASASYDQTIKVWDAVRWEVASTFELPHQGQPTGLAWTEDGTQLISAGVDGLVKAWNVETGSCSRVLRGHRGAVHAVSWWAPTSQVLSAGEDGLVKLWNPDDAQLARTVAGPGGCAWSPDGGWLATGNLPGAPHEAEGTIRILDATDWRAIVTLPRPGKPAPLCLAWSPDAGRLAAGFGPRGIEGDLLIWDCARRLELPLQNRPHEGRQVRSAAWSPDGKVLATSGTDWTVRLWDAKTLTNFLTFREHASSVGTVAWSPDGRHLASRDWEGRVFIWDPGSGRVTSSLRCPGALGVDYPRGVDWSPQGDALAAVSAEGTVMVWETATGKLLHALKGHTANVRSVAWSPDGRRLVSGAEDRTIRLWDSKRGRELLVLPSVPNKVPSVAWSPSGRILTVAGGATLLFDATPGYERAPEFEAEPSQR